MPDSEEHPTLPQDTTSELSSLTAMQQAFVREFLVDRNAHAAARRAGYSERSASQGVDLLKHPKISRILRATFRAHAASILENADRVIEELAGIAHSNVFDFFDVSNGRLILRSLTAIPPHVQRAIKSVKQTRYGVEVTMHDKVMALGLLSKHLGMLQGDDQGSLPSGPRNVTPGPVLELPEDGSSE